MAGRIEKERDVRKEQDLENDWIWKDGLKTHSQEEMAEHFFKDIDTGRIFPGREFLGEFDIWGVDESPAHLFFSFKNSKFMRVGRN